MASVKRTFHDNASSAYILPNDDSEHVRLEAQSKAIEEMMGGIPFRAPIARSQSIQKALDIGCGTGAMSVRLANENPSARVFGVDLSPVPAIHQRPANLEYVVGEFQDLVRRGQAAFEPGTFDFAFSRLLMFGMKDWPIYVTTLYSMVKPGGWVELHEAEINWRDATGQVVSDSWETFKVMSQSFTENGMRIRAGAELEQYMRDAGFVDIQSKIFYWSWSREHWEEHPESDAIGRYSAIEMVPQVKNILLGMLQKLGKTPKEMDEFGEAAGQTMSMPSGGHMLYYAVWGRKP